jgi:hypothetical protein
MDQIPIHAQEFRAKVSPLTNTEPCVTSRADREGAFEPSKLLTQGARCANARVFSIGAPHKPTTVDKSVGILDTKPLFHSADHLQIKQNQQLE